MGADSIKIIEELNTHYIEGQLGNKNTLERLVADEPSLKDKILNFFKGAISAYSDDSKLERNARKLYKTYKKLFEQFSEQNRHNAEVEGAAVRAYKEARINDEIVQFVDKIENGEFKDNDKVELQSLPKHVIERIKKIIGIDVSGFKVVVEARQISHILKDHGKNGETDQSMADPNDIARMEYAMQTPDYLDYGGKTQAYSYMKNGHNRTSETVIYEKEIGDKSYYVVQAVADTKKKTLYIVSTFIGEKGYKKGTSQLINATKSPNATPEVGSVVVPDIIISDNTPNVNSSDENNQRNALPELDAEYRTNEVLSVLTLEQATALSSRNIKGDELLDVVDLASDILSVNGQITDDAKAVLYHGTTHENAKKIVESGKMFGKEDALFFSTKKDGIVLDYGEDVIEVQIPLEKLKLNDVFDSEVHLTMSVKPYTPTNIRFALPEDVDSRTYSYDELVAKGDLTGTIIDDTLQVPIKTDSNGYIKIDSSAVFDTIKEQCEQIKTNAPFPTYYVNVPDIGRNVEIYPNAVNHGYFKGLRAKKKSIPSADMLNARVSLRLPKILSNSIEVNISNRSDNLDTPYSHVMVGTAAIKNPDGTMEYYAVRSVIEERVNQNPILAEARVLGRLHAVNAKKVGSSSVQVAKDGVALQDNDAYIYSIAQFLDDVKWKFEDTFSNDVYTKLGVQRKVNPFSANLRHALPEGVDFDNVEPIVKDGKVGPFEAPFTGTISSVTTEKKDVYKRGVKEAANDMALATQVAFTNEQAGVEWYLRQAGMSERGAQVITQIARAAGGMGSNAAMVAQYDFADFVKPTEKGEDGKYRLPESKGRGVLQIFEELESTISKQYGLGKMVARERFYDYLLNLHNISRMSLNEASVQERAEIEDRLKAAKKIVTKFRRQLSPINKQLDVANAQRTLMLDTLARQKKAAKSLGKDSTEGTAEILKSIKRIEAEIRKNIRFSKWELLI